MYLLEHRTKDINMKQRVVSKRVRILFISQGSQVSMYIIDQLKINKTFAVGVTRSFVSERFAN